MEIVVTTSQQKSCELVNKGILLANFLKTEFIPRNRLGSLNNKSLIYMVVTKEGIVCHYQNQKLFYHPSMAMLRLKRIYKGEEDIFTTLCGNLEGLKILDCTLGFGTDSLILSYLVGDRGEVTALEKSKLIFSIIKDGFTGEYKKWENINDFTQRIKILNVSYGNFLEKCNEKSFDIIYFDPMFDIPLDDSAHLKPLRFFAEEKPLNIDDINIAKKVARKMVIVKNNKDYNFSKIGIEKTFSKNSSKVEYGLIELGE